MNTFMVKVATATLSPVLGKALDAHDTSLNPVHMHVNGTLLSKMLPERWGGRFGKFYEQELADVSCYYLGMPLPCHFKTSRE